MRLQKRKVLVQTVAGGREETFRGVMAGWTHDWRGRRAEMVVWAPHVVTEGEHTPEVPISGHIEIPRENIRFYQIIG